MDPSLKKPSGHVGTRICVAGIESPRDQMVFSMMFHDKILLYIYIINK